LDPTPASHIPRAACGIVMLGATLIAGVGAWMVTSRLAAGTEYATPLLFAMGAGSLATLIPLLLSVGKDFWGVVVLGSGVGRSLIVLAVCYAMQPANLPPRPLFMGALTFVLTLLLAETIMAVKVLSRLERERVRLLATAH